MKQFSLSFYRYFLAVFLTVCLTVLWMPALTGCEQKNVKRKESTGHFLLISDFSPQEDLTPQGGGILVVSVTPKTDITVTATLFDTTVTLSADTAYQEDGVPPLTAALTLPISRQQEVDQICFCCTFNGQQEIYYSGFITVAPSANTVTDGATVTPDDDSYINVGCELVAEITAENAETFWGNTVDDASRPTNNYLPKGTVDYVSGAEILHPSVGKSYRLLRCGRRIYSGAVAVRKDTLPSENRMSVAKIVRDGKYTVFSFDTLFKAPFTLELTGQDYLNPLSGDYRVSKVTFDAVSINFRYCTAFSGSLELPDNPLFNHASVKQNPYDCTLTLTLKEPGAFYGWYAEYDEEDRLNFYFLEPTRLYQADNEYGYALYDATIVVDAGHGGAESGAVSANGTKESICNSLLAFALQKELKSIGATVVMTRDSDTTVPAGARCDLARSAKPDLIISIHRNAGGGNGFSSYYFSPFCVSLAEQIRLETAKTDLYRTIDTTSWHYFFLNRVASCPSVLTENGYMDDAVDFAAMLDEETQQKAARALVRGIIRYYLSLPR